MNNKSGMGVGSASIVLVFAVLCLTIFALISFTAANVDKTMSEVSIKTVKEYYEADTLAECILAEILESDTIPETIRGVDIITDWDSSATYVMYSCPVSDTKSLFVKVALNMDSYDILLWQMQEAGEWETEGGLSVWGGD